MVELFVDPSGASFRIPSAAAAAEESAGETRDWPAFAHAADQEPYARGGREASKEASRVFNCNSFLPAQVFGCTESNL